MSKLMEKPKNSLWTDDQWRAIALKGKDILVAAAAGSGKTAVLVERIIRKILDKNDPADVDQLLVVTFTNAAAAEMRKRVGEALEKALSEDPSSLYIRRQLTLLNRASISTLHSFCIDVLRRYYYKLNLDPGFRIVDDVEAELIHEEVMEDLFESEYSSENNHRFLEVVDRFSGDRDDVELQRIIRRFYDFSQAYPWPEKWLDEVVANYEACETIDELSWTSELIRDIQLKLKGCQSVLEKALEITMNPDGPAPYGENITLDIQFLGQLHRASEESWDALYAQFQANDFSKLNRCKKGECDENLQEKVKAFRDQVKKQVSKMKEELFSRPPSSHLKDIQELRPHIGTLVELVKKYGEKFRQAKQDRALVDFNDLEHLCLELLCDENLTPSDIALDLQRSFKEVLVDEYQDTNIVQETILTMISNGKNMFMVGDVKQSIYRFRLAEPGLFLKKYKQFSKTTDEYTSGFRIDLAKNFRSRTEILDGTNFIFRQVMSENVGDIDYGNDEELKKGADYPQIEGTQAELVLIDRAGTSAESESEDQADDHAIEEAELETVRLEAKVLAKKIKECIEQPKQVVDKRTGNLRNITYRDIVILLRSFTWAPEIMEELKSEGIPVYGELSTGYFDSVEINVIISLLKVIDNPFQDIPLAAVLRSPIVKLSEEDLASIRIQQKNVPFYEALKAYNEEHSANNELKEKVSQFLSRLQMWRKNARQGALSDLIWQIYRETRYYDYVGGIAAGKQRQANLRALFDRARQYESTSFRGLFRFLRFVERLRDRGDDLGAARALGEQEDVVRLMTIHKSKGLEFPVVFIAGLNKQFNQRDLYNKVLLHKTLGFGSKFIDPKLRISYPTIPQLAIRKKIELEAIAEEMRVLYVALTRAKEKLFLIGTVKDRAKVLEQWGQFVDENQWMLPDEDRVKAKSYLDWIGPALVRHKDCDTLREFAPTINGRSELYDHCSKWHIDFVYGSELETEEQIETPSEEELMEKVQNLEYVDINSQFKDKVSSQLSWCYPHKDATSKRSKQSVTEIKRQKEAILAETPMILARKKSIERRPRFLQERSLNAQEIGTAMHMVMQHVDYSKEISLTSLKNQIDEMVKIELFSATEAQAVHLDAILAFFETEVGRAMKTAKSVFREVPFSLAYPAEKAYPDWSAGQAENILVQGVIDCVIQTEQGLMLVDYKTDQVSDRFINADEAISFLKNRYQVQINMYAQALENIWRQQVCSKYLYFFDGGKLVEIN